MAATLRPYEVMVIFEASLEEDDIRAGIDRVTGLITSKGGNPGRVDRWGRRRFAYELNHKTEGYYVLIEAMAPPEVVAELDRMLHLQDQVIRHKVIRIPERVAGKPRPTPTVETVPAAGPDTNGV
jgi:small subunit ribosomal protein S6